MQQYITSSFYQLFNGFGSSPSLLSISLLISISLFNKNLKINMRERDREDGERCRGD
jgi:hypothetical protein